MKFLIFTYFDDNCHHGCSFRELSKLTIPSFQEYCGTHGYDFYCKDSNFTPGRTVGWTKFEIFLEKIDKYDWIFYVECDSMLMNQTIRLENLIDDHHDIIISRTENKNDIELSCGPMLVKSSEWNRDFFNKMLNKKEYYTNQMVEQAAITDEIRNNEESRKHCKIMPLRFFNSFSHFWHLEGNFKVGDFICHAPGCSNDYRYRLFTELKEKIIRIPNYNIETQPFNGHN